MNIKYAMWRSATVFAVVFSFVACENDFETLGGNIVGSPDFNADLYEGTVISASTHDLGPVQTNNLPSGLLGIYNDAVFGKQVAGLVAQLSLSTTDPDFGTEPVIDSVVLHIPYYSTQTGVSEEGKAQFELDSVYGADPFGFQILESNYFLNPFDPETNFEQSQKYFSDLGDQVEQHLSGAVVYETDMFIPSPTQVVVYEDGDTLTLDPGLNIKLDNQYFQTKILDREGDDVLSNQANFRDYIRGMYVLPDTTDVAGSLMLLDVNNADAGITLYYTSLSPDTGDSDDDGDSQELIREPSHYELGVGSTIVTTFKQEDVPVADPSNLYLKGGEGSMAIIELFSGPDSNADGVSDELEMLREKNWLINEARIEFYVNRELVSGENEPEQLYLYDLKNNTVLADYMFDSPGKMNPMGSLTNNDHLRVLERDDAGRGIVYTVRVTEHIQNVLNNDSTNLKLGLVVSQNINLISNSKVKESMDSEIETVPSTSVITPEATVLYGPEAPLEEKRLKLKIYYTESK